MKKWPIIYALLLLWSPFAKAQLGTFGDVPVEINADQTSFEGGLAVGQDNVVIRYGTTTIYCDYAQYNPDSREVLLKGNVRIYGEGRLFVGERAVYNLETKVLRAADFRGDIYPFKFTADSVSTIGPKAFEARDAIMTTSDSSKPDYYLRARTVRIYPNDRIVFSNVTVFLGKTPVFWYPYLYQSLQKDSSFLMKPGYQSIWGAYLLTEFTFPLTDNGYGRFHLDLRSLRGAAVGFDFNERYGKNDESWANFISYFAHDTKPEENDTSFARGDIPTDRYRISFETKTYFTDDIYASANITKLSDALFMQDYQPDIFQIDPQPDNVVSLTKWDDDFTLTGIARAQLNDFFETTERLPEFSLDLKRQPFFDTPVFYVGDISAGHLVRNFPNGSGFPDYSTTRVDSFIEFLYPKTYFNWLSFTPRVGFRGIYYSSTGDTTGSVAETAPNSETLLGFPTTNLATTLPSQGPLIKGGSLFQPVVTAGFDASFKISKAYESVQSHAWGLDGLMHVIQPYTDFSYVHTGENPNRILQFDRFNPSTQLAPLDLANFNTIDSLTDWTILRLGMHNRLETRRDNETFDWLDLDTFFDINMQVPKYPGIFFNQGTFSNVFNNLHWNPLPWFGAGIDSQVPVSSKGFTEVNSTLNFLVNPNLKFDIGDRYINHNPYFQNSNLITFGTYLRINDNWGVSASEQFEAENHQLQIQEYKIHRDLSSWTASLGMSVLDNRVNGAGTVEYDVLLTFTLKDFPQISTPISFQPSGLGGSRQSQQQ